MREVGRPDGDRDSVSVVDEAVVLFLPILSTVTCARMVYGRLVIIRERRQEKSRNYGYSILLFLSEMSITDLVRIS